MDQGTSESASPVIGHPCDEALVLFRLMEDECWTLRCESYSNGDDADVGWEVIEHHMAKPHERIVATGSTPLKAMRAAASLRMPASGSA